MIKKIKTNITDVGIGLEWTPVISNTGKLETTWTDGVVWNEIHKNVCYSWLYWDVDVQV